MSKRLTTAVVVSLFALFVGLMTAAPATASGPADEEMSQQRAGQYYLKVACAGQPAYDRFRRAVFRGRDGISGQEVRRRLPELRRAAGAWAPAIYKEARGLLNPPKAWPESVAGKVETGSSKLLAMNDAVVAMSNASSAIGYVDHYKRAVKLAGQFPGATIRARLDLPPPGRGC